MSTKNMGNRPAIREGSPEATSNQWWNGKDLWKRKH